MRLTPLSALTALLVVATLTTPPSATADTPPPPVQVDGASKPIGPGTTLSTFSRVDPNGWLRGNVLTADLSDPRLTVGLLTPPVVGQVQTVTAMATRQHAFAGVNGDFFDINNTGAPRGIEVSNGQIIKGPWTDPQPWRPSVGVDTAKLGKIVNAFLDGSVTLPAGSFPLDGLNQEQAPPNGLVVFTPAWGAASRAFYNVTKVHELTVVNGIVTAHATGSGAGSIPDNGFVLAGTGTDADLLAATRIGDPVSVTYKPRTEPADTWQALLGVRDVLVRDGQLQTLDDTALNPETAVGFSQDGKKMQLVVIDGRTTASRGVTEQQLAVIMRQRGAYNAVVIDGGGSSSLVSRDPGTPTVWQRNVPSDGVERQVGNGIGLFAAAGSGRLTGIDLETGDKVFTGLHRQLKATGYDEEYGPAELGTPRWLGADRNGLVTGGEPGSRTVAVTAKGVVQTGRIQVLPRLSRITATPNTVSLLAGQTGVVQVTGYDTIGDSAAIDPVDVQLDYDRSLVDIAPNPDGTLAITPKAAQGTGVVTVHVGDRVTAFGVSIGLITQPVTGFDDVTGWKFSSARGSGSLSSTPGQTGNALGLSFDFTQSIDTRTAVASAPTPIPTTGTVRQLDVSVNGDGQGEWLAALITDANGQNSSVYGDHVTWKGWQRTSFTVPTTVRYPITVRGVEAIEATRAQYRGHLDFDDLTAGAALPVTVPPDPPVIDPIVREQSTSDGGVAVLSGVTDRALAEVVASHPKFLVVDGLGTQDPRQAKAEVDAAVQGRFPVYYSPGPDWGPDWTSVFGPDHQTFVRDGVRYVLLNSATGALRTSDYGQLAALKGQLTGRVVVITHGVTDPNERRMLDEWLPHNAEVIDANGPVRVDRDEGVPWIHVPPASTGWTTVTSQVQFRPVLDGISVTVTKDKITATGDQGLPLRYPMSVTWSGSRGVHIGDTTCRWGDVLAFDPGSGAYQRCRPGPASLTITANDASQTVKL
ncbi:phosphodiester glycosidase family protein [Kutzneria sp. CA-103260]|uniref:phosphodiester glycosidase family protein n=1 Tax=Kutzneria sp. CA-103260 TaxID=2802641 RepID=UPI001BADD762|nr:phosphodiester glycosidase family protein [Kutzneria sp. CA-103260]QUQ62738.1 Phosphodiester glycosidase [Kutzneria sp. CA-103260]